MPPKASSKGSKQVSTPAKPVKRGPPPPIKYYLIFFNFLSFFGWVIVLSTLVKHLALGPQPFSPPVRAAADLLARFRLAKIGIVKTYSHLFPEPIARLLERAANSHTFVGSVVALVQSLAILEVVHAAIGWVRSPVITTAIQVASRLFMVWGVSERFSQAWTSPFYASMVLAWAITECIRYPFYANQLLQQEGPAMLWARYTTFFVLYPIGAGSEAMCILATLPKSLPFNNPGAWDLRAYIYAGLFVIWWPGLYVMYTYMMKQRRKVIGTGFWGDKLQKQIIDSKKSQ
ncbi:Protein-tyrosine phosphatase-like, PTPLA [Kalmanozyma brasiliensis GHG001]|uniref:Very-long-chain (3R)-3-hydroxyacyl-CoA dehydratase n=1 Tax=Kalmanozyma brasiliensis (strain GHG001) TaxID=1365824 RepID=V5EVY2_KALBG|nr:Protein-tyrosine phosphatase-like, PTPLA [Kalmanozyma brasiliensis GHG001]EST09660.1 Protein-tyrosine phosphatase-like, PTPLA [Kalmanozyma brasiliensis GHG001]